MKRHVLIVTLVLFISCSSDGEEPDVVDQTDDETVMEEEMEETMDETDQSEETGEEEESTIPFNVSVVLKNIENLQSIDDDFYLQDFQTGRVEPSLLENISEQYSISSDATLSETGRPDILFFARFIQGLGEEYVGLDLDTRSIRSIQKIVLFDEVENDCNFPFPIMWGENSMFSVYSDVCGDVEILRPFNKISVDSAPVIFDEIENAFVGDSFHRFWTTEDYFILHYDHNRNELNIQQDGLVVYDANSLEEKYSTTSDESMSFYVDDNLLALQTLSGEIRLIDLDTGATLHDHTSAERVVLLPKYENTGNYSIGNMDITNDRMGTFDTRSSAIFVPAYYDFIRQEKISVDRQKYLAFFNRDVIDFDADIIEPTEIKYDLESNVFVTSYIAGEPNNPGVLKYSGIMFMDFDGTLLFDYRFPDGFFVDQLVKR